MYDYKEAWRRSYDKATRKEQLAIKKLPNFDADVFYEISGIRVDDEPKQEKNKDVLSKIELLSKQLEDLKKELED